MAAVMLLFRSFGKQAVHHGKVSGATLRRRGMASAASFRFKDLEIELTKNPQQKPEPSELVFGKNFTDHMLTVEWTSEGGWKHPKITPLQPLQLHPGAKALHYSVELFEGMKAYRGVDDKLRLFRPEANMERMNSTAARAALPNFEGEELIQCISKLVEVDKDWVPAAKDCSLYIRPTMIGTEPTLGVSQTEEAMLFVLFVRRNRNVNLGCHKNIILPYFVAYYHPQPTLGVSQTEEAMLFVLFVRRNRNVNLGCHKNIILPYFVAYYHPQPTLGVSQTEEAMLFVSFVRSYRNVNLGCHKNIILPYFVAYYHPQPTLGVSQTEEAMLFVLLGPVGSYFKTGAFNPVSLMADPQYIRAFKGGVGNYKLGSNYGPTIRIQKEAERRGCHQVLWLYGDDHQLTEVGTMNIFMYWENESGEPELVTPPLEGIILPGVTRRSLMDLARGWNECKVTERTFTMQDLIKGLEENRVKELFGAGTACVVCPIDRILYGEKDLHIPTMDTGAVVCRRLYQELTDIQFGRVSHEWVRRIES
ncbi:BCAT2 [Branchiostoma lanceolatum]|uniref:Branched-chain-amino-acid aminotransferase n=1 Tax=Branchiostoma lanceolatum TaxID=7740 RepID=A0A8J9ZQA1_BRALA|nr:BCAT2 [Branchiostoma lanceolatum]